MAPRGGRTQVRRLCLTGVSSLSQRPPGQCHKCVSVMSQDSHRSLCCLSLVTATVSLCLKGVAQSTFRDVFETPVRQMFTPLLCDDVVSTTSFHLRAPHTRLTVRA